MRVLTVFMLILIKVLVLLLMRMLVLVVTAMIVVMLVTVVYHFYCFPMLVGVGRCAADWGHLLM